MLHAGIMMLVFDDDALQSVIYKLGGDTFGVDAHLVFVVASVLSRTKRRRQIVAVRGDRRKMTRPTTMRIGSDGSRPD
jgi:hypothetical protein